MWKSIKWRLIAMYLGLVFIVMIISGSFILISLQNIEIEKAKSQLEVYAQKVGDQVVLAYEYDNYQNGLFDNFSGRTSGIDNQIQGNIINSEGVTVASTVSRTPPFPEYKNSIVIGAFAGNATFSKVEDGMNGQEGKYISYATPVGDTEYVVYAVMKADSIYESMGETMRTIVISVFLALFMAAIMGYVFSRTLTGPIVALTVKAKELAQGRLNQSIKVYSNDEIGQLTESFNYMANALNNTVNEISREKNKFEVILHNMSDGVLSFDHDGNIVHCNSAAKDLLGVKDTNFTFDDFIQRFHINVGVYLDMLGSEGTKSVGFWIKEKYIIASFSPFVSGRKEMEGFVVVIQDSTENKKLDDMRKEFVANVSHELRTPLTTVKSYTETLMDGAIDDRETAMEFLDIVNTEADRMSFLVRDLLQLSRFDNEQIELSYSRVHLNSFISENIRQSKIHAENKNQTIDFTPYKETAFIDVDKDRVTQVLNNILTNAIKYSGEGANISVWADENTSYYRLHVKDTGMGISKEDLGRIFERFYRVDKARSRAMGGTGLGLAIAKEIMESHGGRITAESEYGVGTTMTIWFSKVVKMK